MLVTAAGGNGVPGVAPDSLEARRTMLNDVRRASPMGLMSPQERQQWRLLSSAGATLYRGGRALEGASVADAAMGMHWAPTIDGAAGYMRGRGYQRTRDSIMEGLRALPARLAGVPGDAGALQLGTPYLIDARVPGDAILAYCVRGADSQAVEVLVDFEKLDPATFTDITPLKYAWGAGRSA
jgi:hypothetical protein